MSPYESYLFCDKRGQKVHYKVCQAKCNYLVFDEDNEAFPVCTYVSPKEEKIETEKVLRRAREIEREIEEEETNG